MSRFDPRFDAQKGVNDMAVEGGPPGGPAVFVDMRPGGELGASCKRVHLCMVLDHSGSMSSLTTSGEREDFGHTMWDLARHCGSVAAHSMREGDTLSVVPYSTNARLLQRPVTFPGSAKARARLAKTVSGALDKVRAGGCTNMSDAIDMAFQQMPRRASPDEYCAVVFVSDGEPQGDRRDPVRHARGLSEARPHVHLHTVSIGENARHPLMRQLAETCNGVFRFVSDGTMLGTTIVHTLANVLRGGGPGARLHGDDAAAADLVVATLENNSTLRDVRWAVDLRDRLAGMPGAAAAALLHDVREEVMQGLQDEKLFRKWGYAYILSLMSSVRARQRSNFKDRSGELFSGDEVARIDRVFNDLPAVKPSAHRPGVSRPAPVSMSCYNDAHGGCFGGDSPVRMADGTVRCVRDLARGDRVRGGGVVERVLRTVASEPIELIEVAPGLLLTPYHPVRGVRGAPAGGAWAFPEELPGGLPRHRMREVYNLLMRAPEGAPGHSVFVGDAEAITLAHGIVSDPVARHAFFGTRAVRDWIMDLDADARGVASVAAGRLVVDRHPSTYEVVGLGTVAAAGANAVPVAE